MSKSKDLVQKEGLDAVRPLRKAGVGISVGVGKTLLGLKHMRENYRPGCKFLVVAPKISILGEWRNQAIEHGMADLLPFITTCTYLSLNKQSMDYDVVYLDECHSLKYSHDFWLSHFPGKILGLTGTPPRFEYSEKGKMVAKHCPIVYKYITDDAVEDKLLNDYKIVVHTMELSKVKNLPMHKNGKTWFTSEYESYKYWNERLDNAATSKELQIMRVLRMKALQGFKTKEIYTRKLMAVDGEKTIIFANTQDQAERLCPHSYHSDNPNSDQNLEDFKKGIINRLSCVLQLNEGVNIPNLKVGIILHAYGNERKASQRIGRLMRLNPKDTAIIHILCYKDTVDEQWVKQALEDYDPSKIKWV